MRAGGVSYDLLTRHNIGLNGVVLVSPYMDVAGGGGVGVANMTVGYTMTLSGYAATAWFHDALDSKPADFLGFLAEVDEFAIGEYLSLLVKGARASQAERQAVAEKGVARVFGEHRFDLFAARHGEVEGGLVSGL